MQSLSLEVVERGDGCEPHTEALEVSLRDLTRLTCLKLKYMWRPANEDDVRYYWNSEAIPKAIALMKELRYLLSFALHLAALELWCYLSVRRRAELAGGPHDQ